MEQGALIGLVADRDESVVAHRAIPQALGMASRAAAAATWEWVPTDEIRDPSRVSRFDGLWCVPATPYRDMEGALVAIRRAREGGLPFLGTCGGFQHAVIEYARHVLGWTDAEHAETAPGAARQVIAPLACALVEVTGVVRLLPGTRLARAYGALEATEGYHCRYGLNPAFREALASGPLRVSATDAAGEVRAVELNGHPFFVATLFQPERAALAGRLPPIVAAFVAACGQRAARRRCPAGVAARNG
jgi:CTP synthase (UTP-ammonia lyase)